MRYVFNLAVQDVRENSRIKRGFKDEKGDAKFEMESLGWFIVLEGNVSLRVGDTKPDIVKGQRVKLTVEPA